MAGKCENGFKEEVEQVLQNKNLHPKTGGGIFLIKPTKIRWASQDWTLVQQ
jgi:hypothetical protein